MWECITTKENIPFLAISQVQGHWWANFTITTSVFMVFHKSPRTKWAKTNKMSVYRSDDHVKHCNFCCCWKTGHILDIFPVLGTVTRMGRFPLVWVPYLIKLQSQFLVLTNRSGLETNCSLLYLLRSRKVFSPIRKSNSSYAIIFPGWGDQVNWSSFPQDRNLACFVSL